MTSNNARRGRMLRVNLFKTQFISSCEFSQSIRMHLQDIPGRRLWCVKRFPAFCQPDIHDDPGVIQPDHTQIHTNKEHMDGRVRSAGLLVNKQQAITDIQLTAEHQSFQAAEKTLTILHSKWMFQTSRLIDNLEICHGRSRGCRAGLSGVQSSPALASTYLTRSASSSGRNGLVI